MATSTISIEVDTDLAQAYAAASAEQTRKLQLLLKVGLREIAEGSIKPLKQTMDEVGRSAEQRGLTYEQEGTEVTEKVLACSDLTRKIYQWLSIPDPN